MSNLRKPDRENPAAKALDDLRTLTVQEASKVLGVGAETVRRRVRQGRMEAMKYGNRLRIRPDALRAFQKSCSQGPEPVFAGARTPSGRLILPSERWLVSVVRRGDRRWPFVLRIIDRVTRQRKQVTLKGVRLGQSAEARERAVELRRELNGLAPLPRAPKPISERPLYRVGKIRRRDRSGSPWALRWRDPPRTGRSHLQTIGRVSEQEAEQYRRHKQADLNGIPWEGSASSIFWTDFKRLYLENASRRLLAPTLAQYKRVLSRVEDICRPRLFADVDHFRASQFRQERQQKAGAKTIAKECRILRAIWSWAIDRRLCLANPFHEGRPSQELLTRGRHDHGVPQGASQVAPAPAASSAAVPVSSADAAATRKHELPVWVKSAYAAFERACQERPDLVPLGPRRYTEELHKWARENCEGVPRDFRTWTRYIRDYERLKDGPKNTPRGGRAGRSIASPAEL